MPTPVRLLLDPEVEGRFNTLSFFLFMLLAVPIPVTLLWNWLRRDFPSMPRLRYDKALGIVLLWAMLFVIVLTMISGARELMTPGAWERDPGDIVYKVRNGQ